MDTLEMDDITMDIHPEYQMIPHNTNNVAIFLVEVSPLCNRQIMYQLLSERGEISKVSCALGSTTVAQEIILIDHWGFSDNESVTSTNNVYTIDDTMVDQLFSKDKSRGSQRDI
eukprot:10595240-Ditylum_brightwellii.AAC.1